jgi:hypothetical protein
MTGTLESGPASAELSVHTHAQRGRDLVSVEVETFASRGTDGTLGTEERRMAGTGSRLGSRSCNPACVATPYRARSERPLAGVPQRQASLSVRSRSRERGPSAGRRTLQN